MDKSKWNCHDWRDWLDSQSEDAVVTELQCQYNQLTQQVALLRQVEEVGRKTHSLIRLINLWIAKHSTDKTWKQYQSEINPTSIEEKLMALLSDLEAALKSSVNN